MKKIISLLVLLFLTGSSLGKDSLNDIEKNTYSIKEWWTVPAESASPVVHDDGSITFTLNAPTAQEVKVTIGEWNPVTYSLQKKDSKGWSVTTRAFSPQLYAYHFEVDGLKMLDLNNPEIKVGTEIYANMLEVKGNAPRFDQLDAIPGSLHQHFYHSNVLGRVRQLVVYTPYEYASRPNKRYPVLYLRHGGGDSEQSWSGYSGRAHIILENLISAKKAVPMIIVMTNGLVDGSWASGSSLAGMATLEKELLSEVIPLVERQYRVKTNKKDRAIAGLSMGGGQSFVIGLRNVDRFSWIGEFSSGLLSSIEFNPEDYVPGVLSDFQNVNDMVKLLWISCGEDDPRINGHRELSKKLEEQKINHVYDEVPGGHEWLVWRFELYKFLQLVFKETQ